MTTSTSLWNFACAVYAKPNVKNACLRIQNHHGGNILIIIWLCWLKHQNINLTDTSINTLIDFANTEPNTQLQQLRAIRSRSHSFLNATSTQNFKQQIVAAELVIERAVLNYLEQNSQTDLQAKPTIQASNYLHQLQPQPTAQDIALLGNLQF